jgi:type II secretory pathway pseudopilin PulG
MLLEVMVAILIIAVAAVALLKGFFLTLDNVKRVRKNEQAILLARTLMDDLIIEPPGEDDTEGSFGDDPRFGEAFVGWKWSISVEEVDIRYSERPKGTLFQRQEVIYQASVRIFFDHGDRVEDFLRFETFLMDPDIFSQQALQENQLF